MSYRLIYTVSFSTLDRIPCVVEIEKDGYTGEVTELTPGDSPFTVDIEDEEFLYTPTRFSTATIRIVGSGYLQSLFSIAYQEYRVTFKKNGVVTWCGFIKPELYTQDYTSVTFELELECMSAMSTLEFIDYKQEGENKVFVSLWDLLKKCISSAQGQYTGVCFPYVYAKSKADYDAGINVLKEMTISEQDFFDEDDKPMKLKEVLEEICKFLNWTCTDWRGDLYFVDIEDTWRYDKYKADLSEKDSSVIPLLNDIQDIGFMGSGHSLDILPGYNKVTVKCSNYPVLEVVTDEDFNSLKKMNTIDNADESKASRRVFLHPDKWNMYLYNGDKIINNGDLDAHKDNARLYEGGMLMKFCTYNRHKNAGGEWVPDISDYSFSHAIQIRFPENIHNPIPATGGSLEKIMSFKGPSAIYSDSAISISYSLKALTDSDLGILGNSKAVANGFVYFKIRIGDNYYGSQYSEKPSWNKDSKSRLWINLESANNDSSLDFVNVTNQKTLSMPYTGLNGCIIPIDKPLYGELEFTILCPKVDRKSVVFKEPRLGLILKDFKVKCQKSDDTQDVQEDSNSDRLYENIVNEKYINELDEIEFKISSYNNDGACYSKVMLGDGYLTDNLYSAIDDTTIRPEEQLIRRIIKRYSAPRIKLTQEIKETSALTPISRLYDNYMVNKRFINAGGTIDYKMNKFQCLMIEI